MFMYYVLYRDELRHPSLVVPTSVPAGSAPAKPAAPVAAPSHAHDHAHGLLYASRDVDRTVHGRDYVVSTPASESSFLLGCTDVEVTSFEHGKVASLRVALEYLCACEGNGRAQVDGRMNARMGDHVT